MTTKFELVPAPTFDAVARISRVGAEPAELALTFRHKSRSALRDWSERAQQPEADEVALLGELIEGWANASAPYSNEALADLLDAYHNANREIVAAYMAAIEEARTKN